MEERKLNFNVPLLSVRRSSTPTKSSNGANREKFENSHLNRRQTLRSHNSDFNLDQVTEPVAIPFHWEQIPGRRKEASMHVPRGRKEAFVTQRALDVIRNIKGKKPQDQDVFRHQNEANSFENVVVSGLDRLKEGVNEKAGFNSENDGDNDNHDDVYSDALYTLCPTDSSSVNCSVSGVSGFDNQVVKRSGTFSTDPQTRDFMMSRFLPAAKAMTLETPHYASRKQPVSAEQPRQIMKVVHPDRKAPVNRNESLNALPYGQDIEDEESEDECDDCTDSGSIATKGCGMLPRLCVRNSLSLLNPVPVIKVRAHASMSSTRDDIKKLSKAAYARSQSPSVKKPAKDAVYKQNLDNEIRSPKLVGVENKLSCGSNRFSYTSDRQMISRTSPFRRSGGISPYRNQAPQSPFRGGGFLGIPKELEDLKANKLNFYSKVYSKSQELVSYHGIRRGSCPVTPPVEKTLYVDTVNVAGLLCSNSASSEVNKRGFVDSGEKDLKSLLNSREIQETAAIESFSEDTKRLNLPGGMGKLEHKCLESGEADLYLLSDRSSHKGKADRSENLSQESKALVCASTTSEGNLNIDSNQISNIDSQNAKTNLVQTPLPPLLPKTPSESWLWRTLPSISSQNLPWHLHQGTSFQSKQEDPKTSSTSSKWENIVKSSYLHSDHVRYSEELFPHASQQSKS
ncbi:hypothetical protein P3X46_033145 [Hevea brasiliensis]|uniref:DUF4005 domain-containing protein n=1 Tax=Hevea brasiliensis TaxID=3981 RepID=A0ABQ9KGK6_HEVBR|nr:uncharacterized protein LOC110649875 [Hevea brasiliensis]KAJ9136031.1 hypothetical protein P3X46_033145 [Hevea brasiliensis]